MRFAELPLVGAFVVSPERHDDARGWFARTFCRDEFAAHGLIGDFIQCSASFNARRGTLRGMHYQRTPFEEPKLVRCTAGRIFDVAIDLRSGSPTYCGWVGVELSRERRTALLIPAGCAHGFLTLEDEAEVFYMMGEVFHPEAAAGVRWNDPAFGIEWPLAPTTMADRDASWPDFVR
jgi:dTDP-4-dehydrorhamnose 3,5-epimerase